jgi:Txe/YoeB family toxin of Txe-Axe toxin-antitoxin module
MGNIILLKDQVADIYVLIEDQDPRTSQLAQNLVNELERNPYVKEAKPD